MKELEHPEPKDTLVIQVRNGRTDKTVCEVELPEEHRWEELIDLSELSVYHPDSKLIFFIRRV
jgi:hypothetical protein